MIRRLTLPRPLRSLIALVGTWSIGWGLFRIVRDEHFAVGITAMVLGAVLLVLVLVSQNRGKARSTTPPEGVEKR